MHLVIHEFKAFILKEQITNVWYVNSVHRSVKLKAVKTAILYIHPQIYINGIYQRLKKKKLFIQNLDHPEPK